MMMEKALAEILTKIIEHLKNGDYKNEEHVRVAIVLRILQVLGWDIWNPRECCLEFAPILDEDNKKVDVALFKPPSWSLPAVFIEVKAVGKLEQNLETSVKQLEDYCRRNQAEIAVLTDGRQWHFYLPGASGKFDQRRFKVVDLLDTTVPCEEIERTFCTFLLRDSLISGKSVDQAKLLLKRTDEQRTMDEVLPIARKDAEQDPTASLVECFIKRCADRGISIDAEKAKNFILKKNSPALQPTKPTQERHAASTPSGVQPQPQARVIGSSLSKRMRLVIFKKGVNARGILHSDGKRITVLAGALAAKKSDTFDKLNYAKLHHQLVAEGILVQTTLSGKHNGFKLTQDYSFDSLSAAAAIFCGYSANGPLTWKEDK
jgi:predicted type IV restriction endonuclease